MFGLLIISMTAIGLGIAALGNPVIYNALMGKSVSPVDDDPDLF